MNRKIEQFGVANLYPDNQPPIISFFKRVAIEVELDNGDDFTFTPFFGDFKGTDDIFGYLKKYVEEKNLEKLDIRLDSQRVCIYEINPETLELGEFIEGEGSDVEYYVWNNETKNFDEVDSNSLTDEDEYEDEYDDDDD